MFLEDSVNYAYLMNVLKAMISKAHTLLTIDHLLPHLPQTAMSPTFFDDFRTYCNTEEWLNFMQNYVSEGGGRGWARGWMGVGWGEVDLNTVELLIKDDPDERQSC